MKKRQPAESSPRTFSAVPLDEAGPARVKALAARISLPESHGWMGPEGVWRPQVEVLEMALGRRPPGGREDGEVAIITPIRGKADLEAALRDLGVPGKSSGEWSWRSLTEMFNRPSDKVDPSACGFAVRRPGHRKCEGIFTGYRSVYVNGMEAEAEGEDDEIEVSYNFHPVFIFVSEEARQSGLAMAMSAAAVHQACFDMEDLHNQISAMPQPPKFTTSVIGEAHSNGGLAVLDSIRETMEEDASQIFEDDIQCEADYSL